jgi:hypothetical protein
MHSIQPPPLLSHSKTDSTLQQADKFLGTTVFVTVTSTTVVIVPVTKCVVTILVVVGVVVTVVFAYLHTVCIDIVEVVNTLEVEYAMLVAVDVVVSVSISVEVVMVVYAGWAPAQIIGA